MHLPNFPVYIISKGRSETCLTAKCLLTDKVPFRLVVEPQETDAYKKNYGAENVLTLPFSNLGQGSIPARNWCWEHSKSLGEKRHWILDDNIRNIFRRYKAKRIPCRAGVAFKCIEDFVERYENIAIAGMNYSMFLPDKMNRPPFWLNVHVYSCLLIDNSLPNRWRGRYNEDTDLCLQVLADGWCTVLVNAFSINKMATMKMKGGNMESLYQGDGRLKMARALQRVWPNVATVTRRFKRPQHAIRDCWRKFDTQLKLKPNIKLENIEPNNYGFKVRELKPLKSEALRKLLELEKNNNAE